MKPRRVILNTPYKLPLQSVIYRARCACGSANLAILKSERINDGQMLRLYRCRDCGETCKKTVR